MRKPFPMKQTILAAAGLVGLLSACQTVDEQPSDRVGQATLRLANGLPAGTAQLLTSGSKVNISIALVGLSPGVHAVHLHQVGSCDGPDFTSAGDHLNPQGRQHGM